LASGFKETPELGQSVFGTRVTNLGQDGEGGEEREEVRAEAFRSHDSAEAEAETHEQCSSEEESWTADCGLQRGSSFG